jgi:hypothetical protein
MNRTTRNTTNRWQEWVQALADTRLMAAAHGIGQALAREEEALTESRARALLISADLLDDPTLRDFTALTADPLAVRLALHDLLTGATLPPDQFAAVAPGSADQPVPWLSLALHAWGWKLEYPVSDLDPTTPPATWSPAGQTLHHAAQWVRRQVQRSATERDQQGRKLAWSGITPPSTDPSPQPEGARGEIPVRHFEYNPPLAVGSDEQPLPPVQRTQPVTVSADDLPTPPAPEPEPEIRIVGESRVVPRPAGQGSGLRLPNVTRQDVQRAASRAAESADRLVGSLRSALSTDATARPGSPTTRLRVLVQQYPDGPAVPAVQVSVRHQKSRQEIVGPTDSDGVFSCVLPVRANTGLTWKVTIEWPAQLGGRRETKSITLNADRTDFALPFYARLV